MKPKIPSVLMIVALTCIAPDAPKAHAVIPPPDGGYSNFTTAEGTNALKNLTAGAANTAVGWYSLFRTRTAVSTPLPARERSFSTPDSKIQRLARRRYC
jgi:hypothetical protein